MRLLVAALAIAAQPATGAQPATPPAAAPPPVTITASSGIGLPMGTEVPLILDETLSSQRNVKGDLVHLTVARDVIIDGRVAIAKGTHAVGELTLAERKSGLGVAGRLEAQLLYLERGNRYVQLSGRIAAAGENGKAAAVFTSVAVGGIALVITGKSAIIPAGTAMTARLDHDAWITAP